MVSDLPKVSISVNSRSCHVTLGFTLQEFSIM